MADDVYKQLNFTATEIDTILTAVAGKQDALPAGSNGTYLHRNDTTGALEFVEIPEGAYVIEGNLTTEPEDHVTPITITSTLQDIVDKYQEAPETRFILKLYDNTSEVVGIFNLTPGGFSPSLDSNLVIGFTGSVIALFELPIQNAYHQQNMIVEFGISETAGVYSAEGIFYFTNKIPDSDLCVTVTYNSGTDTYTIDKTYDDFQKIAVLFGQTAFSEIPTVLAMYNNKLYTLNNYDSTGWKFTAIEPTSATVFTRYVLNILWEQDAQDSSVYNYTVTTYTYTIDTNTISNYVDLTTAQTVSGVKTFSNGINTSVIDTGSSTALQLKSNAFVGLNINGSWNFAVNGTNVISYKTLIPQNNNLDLGSSSLRWKDLYLAGSLRDGNNANYGLALPNTTSWTGNKTIATTDDLSAKQDTLTTSSVSSGTINQAVGFDSNGNLVRGTVSGGSGTDNIQIVNVLPSADNAQNNILYKLNNDLYALTETEQIAPTLSYDSSTNTLTAVVDYDASYIDVYDSSDTLLFTITLS